MQTRGGTRFSKENLGRSKNDSLENEMRKWGENRQYEEGKKGILSWHNQRIGCTFQLYPLVFHAWWHRSLAAEDGLPREQNI
ncbi:hypothetical protein Tco_1429538 [Tanacetum coccineum]